jgi:hypothetical protein
MKSISAAAAVAVPVAGFTGAIPAAAATSDRSAWAAAAARLRTVDAEFSRVSAQHSAAFRALNSACPRVDEFFSRYHLGCYKDGGRDRNIRAAEQAILIERYKGRFVTRAEVEEIKAEANRVVDEFDAWLERRRDAEIVHRADEWEERFDAVVDSRWRAREAVIKTDAPDHAALREKIELLAAMLDEEHELEYINPIRSDARRLLS